MRVRESRKQVRRAGRARARGPAAAAKTKKLHEKRQSYGRIGRSKPIMRFETLFLCHLWGNLSSNLGDLVFKYTRAFNIHTYLCREPGHNCWGFVVGLQQGKSCFSLWIFTAVKFCLFFFFYRSTRPACIISVCSGVNSKQTLGFFF